MHQLAKGFERVISTYDRVNLFERVTRNSFHIDPDYEFLPEQDYRHDIRLMKLHLKCHARTIKDQGRYC